MTFHPEKLARFRALFDRAAPSIRAFQGCRHLALWEDARFPNVLSTYSEWESEEALAHYRASDLFKSTWADTKPLFAAAPVAYSQHPLGEVAS